MANHLDFCQKDWKVEDVAKKNNAVRIVANHL